MTTSTHFRLSEKQIVDAKLRALKKIRIPIGETVEYDFPLKEIDSEKHLSRFTSAFDKKMKELPN